MQNKHVVVLSGAGISAESGLKTFRDSGGLWEGHDVMEVASIDGWYSNSAVVLDFYNQRRRQLKDVFPNQAHRSIAHLESVFNVSVITQNVDDLHERAGSSNVIHLHGELKKAKSSKVDDYVVEIGYDDINMGDIAEDGSQLRPAIVWFGEMVPEMERAAQIVQTADILIVVGTSLNVYPAASLVNFLQSDKRRIIIDPGNPELYSYSDWEFHQTKATESVPTIVEELVNNYK